MLKFLAKRRSNLFDVMTISLATLALNDRYWIAFIVIAIAGPLISSAIEYFEDK